jgi:hypothetical protein
VICRPKQVTDEWTPKNEGGVGEWELLVYRGVVEIGVQHKNDVVDDLDELWKVEALARDLRGRTRCVEAEDEVVWCQA